MNYILDENNQPVRVDDFMVWAKWFERGDDVRRVALTELPGSEVSTVFLGVDHSFTKDGPPMLWETLVFGGLLDGEMQRYSSLDAAKAGHDDMVKRVLAAIGDET